MDFRVYVTVEIPILDQKYELIVPADRRIHELIKALHNAVPELSQDYYKSNTPLLYNKSSGHIYDMNNIIKNTDIKTGTRLILI